MTHEDEVLCERCNEWFPEEDVGPMPFASGDGFWMLCEDCARDVVRDGEES